MTYYIFLSDTIQNKLYDKHFGFTFISDLNHKTVTIADACFTKAFIKSFMDNVKDVASYCILIDSSCNDINAAFPNNVINIDDMSDDNLKKTIRWMFRLYNRENLGKQKLFITSDTHFNHNNIIRYCNRPFASVEEMNEKLIANWNSVVGKDDRVIHLGDFAFGGKTKVEPIVKRLNGQIDLVLGNHDNLKFKDYYDLGFHRVYDHPIIIDNFYILSHVPLQWITEDMPYAHIFGHVHTQEMYRTYTRNTCCACIERHDYKPVEFEKIKQQFENANAN